MIVDYVVNMHYESVFKYIIKYQLIEAHFIHHH